MKTLREVLTEKNIHFSLHYYGIGDYATVWEVKTIAENPEVFDSFFEKFPLGEIKTVDDVFLYFFSLKLCAIMEIVPLLVREDYKNAVTEISLCAERELTKVSRGEVIKYVNSSIAEIFDESLAEYDFRQTVIEFIEKNIDGISRDALSFLAENHGYMLVDRFSSFEHIFEKWPDLFEKVFEDNTIEELRFTEVLHVWEHIIQKKKSALKDIAQGMISQMFSSMESLSENATIDNAMYVEQKIRKFTLFLQKTKNPLANKILPYKRKAEELLSQHLEQRGQSFSYEIPVGEIVSKWRKTEPWEVRLLTLTHTQIKKDEAVEFASRLSRAPEHKKSLIDMVSTTFPTDGFFTFSHQQWLEISENMESGVIFCLIMDEVLFKDLCEMMNGAICYIRDTLWLQEETIIDDTMLLLTQLHMVSMNAKAKDDSLQPLCYGAATYTCALTEKILRLTYEYLLKDEVYLTEKEKMLGNIFSDTNLPMQELFGKEHLKNVGYFLIQQGSKKIGCNYRNRLAHWDKISCKDINVTLVSRLLWIFIDVLNTIFWFAIKENDKKQDTC